MSEVDPRFEHGRVGPDVGAVQAEYFANLHGPLPQPGARSLYSQKALRASAGVDEGRARGSRFATNSPDPHGKLRFERRKIRAIGPRARSGRDGDRALFAGPEPRFALRRIARGGHVAAHLVSRRG